VQEQVKMKHIKAPEYVELSYDDYRIFLGGSIEMGAAEHWQQRLADALDHFPDTVFLFNPRRDDWDSSWIQDPAPGTQFHTQVTWELVHQELAHLLVYYFDPNTKSVITMMELGAYGLQATENTIVCCPKDFWRYGNVAVFCNRYNIELVHTFEELVLCVIERIITEGIRT
jgi:hypothetical protein